MPNFDAMPTSPFTRLNKLLEGVTHGPDPIVMSVGEPQHAPPDFVLPIIERHLAEFAKYPPIIGPEPLRQAVAQWVKRRYRVELDPARQILPLVGTREGLFSAAFVAVPEKKNGKRPAVLIPNPFYQAYSAAALSAGADPVYVNATRESGFLPDFASVPRDVLERTAAIYICSPSNPEGAAANGAYWRQLFALADEYDFTVLADECYGEIYTETAPTGALEIRSETSRSLERLLAFHSLSKRSNLAGLRSGFVAGNAELMAKLVQFRNVTGPQLPLPLAAVSTAAWSDETHVVANRALYAEKFQAAQAKLGNRFGFHIPAGSFFLWLDVGDGEEAALKLWREGGVKVLPGGYLARETAQGNPGKSFIRVALVNDIETTREALDRIARIL
ncbi:MAG: aminotransferase class I/II-fold pyridoxal phosphate-dependent enzyme [Alphaproteobacteria bacterium]|nr:aminotransferase class I/II-fold pyridoxal phosphate-dependent enzyme [Alphaproteobacteria bacterium]